jgi:hypothetical protein
MCKKGQPWVKTWYNELVTPKLKFFFKDCIGHVAFMHWSIIPPFFFWIFCLQLYVTFYFFYYILILCHYMWCIHALYHKKMNNFFSRHIFKIYNFQGQKHIWTKSAKMCCKHEFHQFQLIFLFKLLLLQLFPTLRKNRAHLICKKDVWNNKIELSMSIFWIFKHAKGFLKH